MNKFWAAVAAGSLSALAGAGAASAEAPARPGDYPMPVLGASAIAAGDWAAAETRLSAAPAAMKDDPAWLINRGEVFYRTGRLAEARAAWEQALTAPRPELVTLRDGRVASTDALARTALRRFAFAAASD